MSGDELRKGTFAESFNIDTLVDIESADAGEEKDPIGDGCNAFIRRNRGMKGKGNEETGRRDNKTPVVVHCGNEREEEEEQKSRNGNRGGEFVDQNFAGTFFCRSWRVHRFGHTGWERVLVGICLIKGMVSKWLLTNRVDCVRCYC